MDVIIPKTVCHHMHRLKHWAKGLTLTRHAYLYLENDASDTVYMLEKGMVTLTKLLPEGHEVGIAIICGNNLFGQCEVLSHTQREHQAKTLTQCKIWAVNARIFLEETEKSGDFALSLAQLQNERLRHVEKHISTIYQSNVAKRLTTTLLEIAHSTGCESGGRSSIRPCPTHQDLATMISSTRETVSTVMGRLRKSNIIDFNRKELIILSEKLLYQYTADKIEA